MLIPPLERIFNLVGANVRQWFEEMPKPARLDVKHASSMTSRDGEGPEFNLNDRYNIDEHFRRMVCVVCKQPSDVGELTRGFAKTWSDIDTTPFPQIFVMTA
jgi:DNA polymerase zeta